MNTEQLLNLHDETCSKCKEIMKRKNSDYTGGKNATDVFANFNSSVILQPSLSEFTLSITSFISDAKDKVDSSVFDLLTSIRPSTKDVGFVYSNSSTNLSTIGASYKSKSILSVLLPDSLCSSIVSFFIFYL